MKNEFVFGLNVINMENGYLSLPALLVFSIRRFHKETDIKCFISNDIKDEFMSSSLKDIFIKYNVIVEFIDINIDLNMDLKGKFFYGFRQYIKYLSLKDLNKYDNIIYIDVDAILLKNIDTFVQDFYNQCSKESVVI